MGQSYHPNDPMGVRSPLFHSTAIDLPDTTTVDSEAIRKPIRKNLPAVFDGLDKPAALAFVARLFDAADAGVAIWSDELLIDRFLLQCSRSGSQETVSGYAREIRVFCEWRDRAHPHLALRQLHPAFCQDWVDSLRREVEAGLMAARTFNRRLAAISSMYRYASEPSRAAATGVPRNPMPARALMQCSKTTRGISEEDVAAIAAEIKRAAKTDSNAGRDLVLIKGSYLTGARVSEVARLRWRDVERVGEAGLIHVLGKGNKARSIRVSPETLALFETLGRGDRDSFLFPSPRRDTHLSRQAIRDVCVKWGKRAGVPGLHPHRLRHSHATHSIRRGCDVFTLQSTLGHASSGTTGHYVASNPEDSSSLRLG